MRTPAFGSGHRATRSWRHPKLHKPSTYDAFGLSGTTLKSVALRLSVRAYLLLREEHPMTLPYLKAEDNIYTFQGPVASYTGIGRFVMGLMDEIQIIAPEEFKVYVKGKLNSGA